MRVNHYVCDICGEKFLSGEGFRVNVTFPIDERFKNLVTRNHYRKTKSLDFCVVCGVERLGIGAETDKDVDNK